MMAQSQHKGRCLCGAVTLTATPKSHVFGACHCKMCQRWGGGPLLAIVCGTNVVLDGKDDIAVFDSSEWAERGFCRQCGTHLYYRMKQELTYAIPIGVFDDIENWHFGEQIFIEDKPSCYSFADQTVMKTGKEVFG